MTGPSSGIVRNPMIDADDPQLDLRSMLDTSDLVPFHSEEQVDWKAGFDLEGLTPKQVEFVKAYFCVGDSQYHQGRSAAKAGVTHRTVLRWRTESPTFAACYEAAQEYQVSEAEAQLMQLVRSGDLRAVTYALDRIGGKRWSPKANVDVTSGGHPVGFRIEIVQPGSTQTPQSDG